MLYFPVDAAVEPAWCGIVSAVDVAVAYTRYGRDQVRRAMGKSLYPIEVLPHGVEDYFRPLPDEARAKYRDIEVDDGKGGMKHFVKPGDYLILNVNKNEWRKDLFRSLEILAGLRQRGCPAKLVLRTAPTSLMGGIHIEQAARQLGLTAGVEYCLMPAIEDADLVGLYNAADLYLTTTRGEGWGLGITEALACGCPVALPDHTSCAEIAEEMERLEQEETEVTEGRQRAASRILLGCDTAMVCGADSRVRPQVQLELAVDQIHCHWRTRSAERGSSAAKAMEDGTRNGLKVPQREWLSWRRIAGEMLGLLLNP
jgi:glycosyltransferase involved in cell wall biosynthesis